MNVLDNFKKRMSMSGNSIRDENIKNSKQLLENTFLDDASANPNIVFWKTEIPLKCRIFDRKFSPSTGVIAKIQVFINNVLTIGDILIDTKEQQYWLCTEMFNIDDVHKQGKMQLCNWTLLFQSPTGTILSYPCIDEAFNRLGENETDTLTEGNAQHTIKLPFDENTILIREDMRFFLDKHPTSPTTYKVTQANTTTYNYGDKGLIVLSLKQDKLILTGENPDRVDLGVCNYKEVVSEPIPVVGYSYAEITCSNISNEITIGGSSRTLTPKFYNADATLSSENIIAVWTWNFPIGYDSFFNVTYVGNIAKISVAENYDLLGMTVTGNVMSSNGGYGGSITLEITI